VVLVNTARPDGFFYVFFFSFRIFFRTTRELEYLIFLSRKARNFFQYLTLDYMTKTLNKMFFFPPPKSEYLFSNIGNQKLNGPSLMNDTDVERTSVLRFKFTKCFDL
jgi:hypothetical protein